MVLNISEFDVMSSASGMQKKRHGSHMDTVGVVDMGGGSLQIAFEVQNPVSFTTK